MTNTFLKVRVLFCDRWEKLIALSDIGSSWSTHLLWSHLLLLLTDSWLCWHSWLNWHSRLWLHSLWSWWCHHSRLWHTSWLLLSHHLILVTTLMLSVVVVWSSLSTTIIVLSMLATLALVLIVLSLHKLEKLLDDLSQVWLTGQIIPLESTGLLLSILFPISLIFEFSHLHSSDLFDFIIVDDKNFTIKSLVL